MVRSYRASEILRVILRFVLRRNETQTKRMVKFNGTASVHVPQCNDWNKCNSFSHGDDLSCILQMKCTLIRQLLQELFDQGTLYLLMHDPRMNIFLCTKTKNI